MALTEPARIPPANLGLSLLHRPDCRVKYREEWQERDPVRVRGVDYLIHHCHSCHGAQYRWGRIEALMDALEDVFGVVFVHEKELRHVLAELTAPRDTERAWDELRVLTPAYRSSRTAYYDRDDILAGVTPTRCLRCRVPYQEWNRAEDTVIVAGRVFDARNRLFCSSRCEARWDHAIRQREQHVAALRRGRRTLRTLRRILRGDESGEHCTSPRPARSTPESGDLRARRQDGQGLRQPDERPDV